MCQDEKVFISYSWDSPEHMKMVLDLSDKLRSEGVDCEIDQYEESPSEGWPLWMDKKIRDAKHVLLICTESYYKRVMNEEVPGIGFGIRWEGSLIYQHIYNAGTTNTKFIPVIVEKSHRKYIPTPLQGCTSYCLNDRDGHENLYMRLIGQSKVEKPELGKRKPLPEKPVSDRIMYMTSSINLDLWDKAEWKATGYIFKEGYPPALGLAFKNEEAARKIFEGWHRRYGNNDELEEIRISIIEGDIKDEEPGYTVHINTDLDANKERFRKAGYKFDKNDLLITIGRCHRMNPSSESNNLETFKELYRKYKTYFLVPCVYYEDNIKPILELGIYKGKIMFRNVNDIGEDDIDIIVFGNRK